MGIRKQHRATPSAPKTRAVDTSPRRNQRIGGTFSSRAALDSAHTGKPVADEVLLKLSELAEQSGSKHISVATLYEEVAPLLRQRDGKPTAGELAALEVALEQFEFSPAAKVALTDELQVRGHVGVLEGAFVDRFQKAALPHTQPVTARDAQLARSVLREMSQSLGLRDDRALLDRLANLKSLAQQATRPAGGLDAIGVPRTLDIDASEALTRTFGPMGDLLYLDDAMTLKERQPEIQQHAKALAQFNRELGSASSLNELRGLGRRWGGQRIPSQCLNQLLKKMMNHARGDDASGFVEGARFYEETVARNVAYGADQIGREFYLTCLNASGQVDRGLTEARRIIDEATGKPDLVVTPESVRDEETLNGEVLANAAKALKEIADKASSGEPPSSEVQTLLRRELGIPFDRHMGEDFDWGRAALEVSTRYNEAGFTRDFEFHPGIYAVHQNLLLGNAERAEQLAPMVYKACEAAGGKEEGGYWCVATQMQAALVMGRLDDFADLLPQVLLNANSSWKVATTIKQMSDIADLRERDGHDVSAWRFATSALKERIHLLDGVAGPLSLKERRSGLHAPAADVNEWTDNVVTAMNTTLGTHASAVAAPLSSGERAGRRRTEAIVNASADFRALTNSHAVGGNVAFGGQIPDITITRQSVQVVRSLLDEWGIAKIDNFADWNKAVNARLNEIFDLQDASGRRPLEDLHSSEHEVLDAYDNKRFSLAATADSGDSRTDLLALMALGIGDCRPTAYAKQLFFDVWQDGLKADLMREAFSAITSGDQPAYEACMAQVKDVDKIQLRTITCCIEAPVQMREMYDWKTDDNGRPLRDTEGQFNPVENHTFNILVEVDDRGLVKDDVIAADGFYQELYPLDGMKLSVSDLLEGGAFEGDRMGIKADDGGAIPFRMVPAAYSGGLLKEFDVGSTDFRFCGQTVAPPSVSAMLFEGDRLNAFARTVAALDLTD